MNRWAKCLPALFFLLFFAETASAQGSFFTGNAYRYTPAGIFAASSASVTVCTSAGSGTPCTPTITVYKDAALAFPVANPLPVCGTPLPQFGCIDGLGNFSFYASTPGPYTYTITGAGLTAYGPIPITASPGPGAPLSVGSLNNIKIMDGVKYALTGTGLAQALSDAGANGTVMIPPNTTVAVDTTTPLAITLGQQSIMGMGQGSAINYTGAGNLFNVNASGFNIRDLTFNCTGIVNRASVSVFNFQANGSLGNYRNLTFNGAVGITNNGRVFNADLTNTGTGENLIELVRVTGGPTWTNALFLRTSTGTVSGWTVNNLISFLGVTYSDAAVVADTGVDTLKMSQLEIGGAGVGINTRNTLSGQAPRWIYCYNCEIETSGANAGIQLDAVRVFQFIGGQIATAQNAVNAPGAGTGGVNQVSFIGANFQNIQQHCVLIGIGTSNISFTGNTLEDCGVAANNTYDYFNVAAAMQDFHIDYNHFRQLNANKARYGVNVLAGASNFYTVFENDFAQAAIGTAYINNLGTGTSQLVCNSDTGCRHGGAETFAGTSPQVTFQGAGAGMVFNNTSAPASKWQLDTFTFSGTQSLDLTWQGAGGPFGVVKFVGPSTGGTGILFPQAGGSIEFVEGSTNSNFGPGAGTDPCRGDSTAHSLVCSYNNGNFHPLKISEAGSCAMVAGTTCTFSITNGFTATPLTFASIDAASTVPATANSAKCSVSGTTVTVTAGISNSLTWDCLLVGNPN